MALAKSSSDPVDESVEEALEEIDESDDVENPRKSVGILSKTKAKVSSIKSSMTKGATVDLWDQVNLFCHFLKL